MSLSIEEITRMAHEAGLTMYAWEYAIGYDVDGTSSDLQRFANAAYAAGVAAERDACAKVCDRFQERDVGMKPAECAAAIRARGNGGEK